MNFIHIFHLVTIYEEKKGENVTHKCDFCGKFFSCTENIKKHFLTVHETVRVYNIQFHGSIFKTFFHDGFFIFLHIFVYLEQKYSE